MLKIGLEPGQRAGGDGIRRLSCQPLLGLGAAVRKQSPKNLFIEQGQGELSLQVRPP